MRWFSELWLRADYRAPVCEDDALRIPVPVGEPCLWCDEEIQPEDRGEEMARWSSTPRPGSPQARTAYTHIECLFRQGRGRPRTPLKEISRDRRL